MLTGLWPNQQRAKQAATLDNKQAHSDCSSGQAQSCLAPEEWNMGDQTQRIVPPCTVPWATQKNAQRPFTPSTTTGT